MSHRPWLVLVTGEPGSGKTELGLRLSNALRVPFMSRDQVRGGLLATAGLWTDQISAPTPREDAVEALVAVIETMAAVGVTAVLEFVVVGDRLEAFKRLTAAAQCIVIRTTCVDAPARAHARDLADPLLNRREVLDALGSESVAEYLGASADGGEAFRLGIQTEFDLPLLAVSTDDGYDPPLHEVVDWIVTQTRR